jgi:PAS domain S-box-containing protein
MPPIDADTYRTLFETAPDATLVIDEGGRIVLANTQAERLFGRPREELLGIPVEELVPERFRAVHVRHREHYHGSGAARMMGAGPALLALRADGAEIPVEIALGPIEGTVPRLYMASVRDISGLARTRQAAQRGRYNFYVAKFGLQALAEPQFATLIDAAGPLIAEAMQVDAVVAFRLTPDQRELQGVSGFGISTEALSRMRAPNDPSCLPGYLTATRQPVLVTDIESERRFEILDVVRELGLRSALCVPLMDAGEVIGGLTARAFAPREWSEDDVHFMQAIANTLSTALQRAATEERLLHAQRLEALGQLTGGVAHDFNNLLMVISGNLQMVEDLAADRPQALALARQAIGAAERGAMLTRKLLAFARKQPLHPRPVDLNQLVTEFRDLVQRTLGEQVAVRLDLDPALPVLVADAAQVETALLNLALNARDAMPSGGELTLATGLARFGGEHPPPPELAAGEYARLCVSDTGLGMDSGVLARAIEPFFTTKEAGKGSGLGLSMVYGFARQSEGTVQLESEPGRGTKVTLYLPLPAEDQDLQASARSTAPPSGSETVLVVEDEPRVLEIAVAFLGQLGYRVLQARDAKAALRLLAEHAETELVFTDVSLPGMDGIALAEQARALLPGIRVLFASAYLSGSALDRLPGEERRGVLAKPYRREELAFRIRTALARRMP